MASTICGNCGELATSVKEVKQCYGGVKSAHDPAGRQEAIIEAAQRKGTTRPKWGPGSAHEARRQELAGLGPSAGVAEATPAAAIPLRRESAPVPSARPVREPSVKQPDAEWRKLPEGIYVRNGQTWTVKIGKDSGTPYALRHNANGTQNYMGIGPLEGMTLAHRTGDIPQAAPKEKPVKAATRVFTEEDAGMYRTPNGKIHKLYKAVHGSGEMCVQELVLVEAAKHDDDGDVTEPASVEFKYLGHSSRFMTDKHIRLTLEDARAFGEVYGICMRCGRELTKDDSITAGLGSTCITYFPGAVAFMKERKKARSAARKAAKAALDSKTAAE